MTTKTMTPGGILETALYASDLAAAEQFYTVVLNLEVRSRMPGRHVFFRCGRGMLLVFNPEMSGSEEILVGGLPIPRHGTTGPGHAAFAVEAGELDAWRNHLKRLNVLIESEIDWPGGGHSIYFRDPAGNSVELATPNLWGFT